ncbi:uncharacterized protein [Euphorbia lathyris]|uniref:uncharacterized protein n=1 Tax=Euphorbia lathyris TaxID=212925 RepID=UPI0033137E06
MTCIHGKKIPECKTIDFKQKLMATIMTFPEHSRRVQLPSRGCLRTGAVVVSFTTRTRFHKAAHVFGPKLYSQCSYVCVAEPFWDNNFRRLTWKIRSNVDSGELDPSPSNSSNGRTRLFFGARFALKVHRRNYHQASAIASVRPTTKQLPLTALQDKDVAITMAT